jgi:putative membrane protein
MFFVILVIGYHHACWSLLKKFRDGVNARSGIWFRWFNEVPVILLLVVTALVVIKP